MKEESLRPGDYYVSSVFDPSPPIEVIRKTKHTREWMEANYEMVDFCPPRSGPVTVNGVQWVLAAHELIRVPSIVRDVLLSSEAASRGLVADYPLLTPEEDAAQTEMARKTGKTVWSPVQHVGFGFFKPDHVSDKEWAESGLVTWEQGELYRARAEQAEWRSAPVAKRVIRALRGK